MKSEVPLKVIADRAEAMRVLPASERQTAIAAGDNVIEGRLRFRPVRVPLSSEDCA